MARQTESDDRRYVENLKAQPPMLLGKRADDPVGGSTDKPMIKSDGRYAKPNEDPPPDPRAVIEDLRRKLRAEQEKSLNARDAVMGARAAAAQAKAETQETFYRLHVRETELAQLKELVAGRSGGSGGGGSSGAGSFDSTSLNSTSLNATSPVAAQPPNRIEHILGRPVRSVVNPDAAGAANERSIAANATNTARSLLAAAKRLVAE